MFHLCGLATLSPLFSNFEYKVNASISQNVFFCSDSSLVLQSGYTIHALTMTMVETFAWNVLVHAHLNFYFLFSLVFLFQLIEVQRSQFQSQEDLRQQIKMASFIAGLQGKQVVLFVPEGVNDESMQDICSLMAEGKS